MYRSIECYVVTFLRKQNLVFICRQGVVVLFNMVVFVKMQSGVFRARPSVRFASMLLKMDDTAVLILLSRCIDRYLRFARVLSQITRC